MRECGKSLRAAVFVLLAISIFTGCDDNEPSEPVTLTDYFPLQTGNYFIYDVEETTIAFNVEAKEEYALRVVISDSVIADDGTTVYVMSRSRRNAANEPWQPLETWSARQSVNQLIISEGNVQIVALVTPLVVGQQWNGNELNNRGGREACGVDDDPCDVFTIESLDANFQINGDLFNTGLLVIESDDPDPLTITDVRKAVYGNGIGLISVDREVLDFCTTPPSCFGTGFVNSGYRYKQTLTAYGKE